MAYYDEQILRDKGGFTSPLVKVIPWNGGRALCKDYGKKNAITRALIAPYLVRRECAILKRLDGIAGIPKLYKVEGRHAIVMEYIEGKHIGKFGKRGLSLEVYDELRKVVEAMHGRDVVHLDLRQKKNIVIATAGRPYVIDFANALHIERRSPLRPLFGFLKDVDLSALLKLKNRYVDGELTAQEREFLARHHKLRRFWFLKPLKLRGKDVVW